jgi:hypothetical protein
MDEKEYKEDHIPHRVNLLITYRERFANLSDAKRQNIRDLDRCAKDISMLMVRFFFNELGIGLSRGQADISPRQNFKFAKSLVLVDVVSDPLYQSILEVLTAANRAVAHIEPSDVNHNFKTALDDKRIFDVITYVENKIKSHIYGSDREFEIAMSLPNNNMHRDRLKL